MNSSFHRLKSLETIDHARQRGGKATFACESHDQAILLDGSESRLLTAQDSAAAKPLLLFQSKSHDSMDSTQETTDCARRHSCEATFVYESHDYCFPNLSAYKPLALIEFILKTFNRKLSKQVYHKFFSNSTHILSIGINFLHYFYCFLLYINTLPQQ